MLPMLAVVVGSASPLITFIIVGVIVAVVLAILPKVLEMDAPTWSLVRLVVIVALLLWALRLFGVI